MISPTCLLVLPLCHCGNDMSFCIDHCKKAAFNGYRLPINVIIYHINYKHNIIDVQTYYPKDIDIYRT